MNKLSKQIELTPLGEGSEDLQGKYYPVIRADDIRYIEDKGSDLKDKLILGACIALPGCIALLIDNNLKIFFLIFAIPAILTVLYGFVAPKKKMILDRVQGQITLARPLFYSHKTISFEQGVGLITYYSSTPGLIHSHLAFMNQINRPRYGGKISEHELEKYWSFTVWYMDKNRPLPPGSAFDAFREKDFERRKAEGFPKPLYPSNIETPEHTKEQQALRKKIGGW